MQVDHLDTAAARATLERDETSHLTSHEAEMVSKRGMVGRLLNKTRANKGARGKAIGRRKQTPKMVRV